MAIDSLSMMENNVRILRTVVTTLYEHATFDPNKRIVVPDTEQLNNSMIVLANGNVSLRPTEAQTVDQNQPPQPMEVDAILKVRFA